MIRFTAVAILMLSLPMPMRLAAESTISLTDWTGRGFVDDVVSYRYAGKGTQASLRLTDPNGKIIPVQLDQEDGKPVVLSVAHLPANKTLAYQLSDAGGGAAPASPVAVASEGKNLVLRGGKAAVRLPASGRQVFAKPVAWKDLPPPIQGFTRGDGTWLGGGKMLGDLTVSALAVAIVAQGPVRASARYQVTFSSGGSYEALISVDQGLPLIRVEETYDLKQDGVPVSWDLDLTNGWSPKQIETASVSRNGQGDAGATMPSGSSV